MAVLTWANIRDNRPGRRSSGNFSKNIRLMNRGRNTGLLDIIVEITNGKCLLSFDVAAPIQITMNTSLAATIMSTPANRNVDRERGVDLAAGGQEDHLVAQAEHGQHHQDRHDLPRRQQPDGRCRSAGIGPVPSENNATSSITSSAP